MASIETQSRSSARNIVAGSVPLSHLGFGILLLTLLVGVVYAPVVRDLVLDWWNNPDYSYGFLVPVFSGYMVWRQRERLRALKVAPSGLGLALILLALSLLVLGTYAIELFTARVSLVFLIAGMVLFFAGPRWLSAVKFPLAYLLLMIPLPMVLFNQISVPLALSASHVAESLLHLVGTPAYREGNILVIPNFTAEVAQACSGIRSLLCLFSLAIGFAYFAEERLWTRVVLVALMLPIAIFTNGIRIMVSALMAANWGPEWAEGFSHTSAGMLVFLVALGLLFLADYILNTVVRLRRNTRHG